jgi:hypothetical protein
MHLPRMVGGILIMALLFAAPAVQAASDTFVIQPFSANDFGTFVKVFSELRGPLRKEILKDRKTNFENADPLKYVEKVKDKRDVRDVLAKSDLSWDQFVNLWGNIMLGYFSIQPEKTKAALIRQIADYGLFLQMDELPAEARGFVTDVLKTDAGASLASMALEALIQIPQENVAIVRDNQRDLARMFYTKYWIDELK